MKKININFSKKSKKYTIFIGNNLIGKISKFYNLEKYSKVFIITDKIIEPLFLDKLLKNLPVNSEYIILPNGEKEKNIESIQKIYSAMFKAGCDRRSLVVNMGGGVICDMGSFAASTYMRGIDFINIPTTLLSQVDASVGGKTGFDFLGVKNLIGTFDQPKAVIIEIETLKTLPKREFLSGFGEIIKHGLILDKKYFEKIIGKDPFEFSIDELSEIIYKSCNIKKQIVELDEKENGARKLLNFGHTVGHAVESLSLETDTPLLHGEAVSIGMVAESKISQRLGLISELDALNIKNNLENFGLPTFISNIKIDDIKNKMLSDKKNDKKIINFTLLEKIGKAIINQKAADDVIDEALKYILNKHEK